MIAMDLRRFSWVFLLAGLGVLGGIAAILLTPHLAAVEPAPDAIGVPGNAPLRITFTQAMQAESAQAHVSLDPPVAGSYAWEGKTLTFTPTGGWPSGGAVRVAIQAGAASRLGLKLKDGLAWSFTVRGARVAYLWPAGAGAELYALDVTSDRPAEKLPVPAGVLDFSVAAQGNTIYYSLPNATRGSDLYALDLDAGASRMLLACPEVACRNPQPSPDGQWLAFERTGLSGAGAGMVQVYLLPLGGGGPAGAGEAGHSTRVPVWSAGGWLAFYDASRAGYVALRPGTGERAFFPNNTGDPGTWSADGLSFVAAEMSPPGADRPVDRAQSAATPSRLMLYAREGGSLTDLTHNPDLEDTSPAFTPDGKRLAFARRALDEASSNPGRQLWLMNADGGGAKQISNAPFYNYFAFAWSPDGGRLAFLRSSNTTFTQPPELWLLDLASGDLRKLADGAYSPQWVR